MLYTIRSEHDILLHNMIHSKPRKVNEKSMEFLMKKRKSLDKISSFTLL